MPAIRDDFSGNRYLWTLIVAVAVCFVGIGALFLVELPPKIETVAYYALFTLGFISAVFYNIISLKKGRWLFRRMKEEAKRRAGKNGGK